MNLGARRIDVSVGKIATRKTWIYKCVVHSSSMCVQVTREYRLEGHRHAPTGQFGGMGSCSTWRGGCDTRLKVGKSKNGGYDREGNQRCKGPHCAESKFDARGLGPNPDMTRGNQIARTDEETFPGICNPFVCQASVLYVGISCSTSGNTIVPSSLGPLQSEFWERVKRYASARSTITDWLLSTN